jgi:hypothetical protein
MAVILAVTTNQQRSTKINKVQQLGAWTKTKIGWKP